MAKKEENEVTIGRRSVMLGLGGIGVFGVLASRLYYLQVVEAENYKVLSDQNRFNFNIVMPERGRILDRFGEPIATNIQDFRLVIVPERVKNLDLTLDKISTIIPISQANRKRIRADVKKSAKFVPVLIDEHLDWQAFSTLSMKLPEIPGAIPLAGQGRNYPQDGLFAHILGYVGKPNEEAFENDKDPLLHQPAFRMGKTGVEASQDVKLRGKAGRQKVEVNALGRTVREWDDDKIEAEPGQDVWLTLDAEMQKFTADLFGEESGGAALIDVMTGELRTLLSMPIFDNNLFVSGLTSEDMKRMNSDPKRPQFNKVLGGGYPPASTFKMAVMLAALKHRIVKPTDKVFCVGKTRLGNRTFHCWKRRGHGSMDMHDALQHSCDTYFYEIIQRLGMDKVKPIAEALGLGQRFDLGLAGQITGAVPNAEWKQQKLGQAWRMGDALNAAIGQGFVLVTPLQLAVMAARLANGKKAIAPSLIVNEELPEIPDLGIDENHIKFVQNAMFSVCERPGGTAYRYNGLGIKGVKMAGKTGTGQVRGISKEERLAGVIKNNKLPWKYRDHSIFVGYAPYDNPRFAASVIVEHGGSGARMAANICRAVLSKALKKDGIEPQTASLNLSGNNN
jgi:penicillin-binding protein 2